MLNAPNKIFLNKKSSIFVLAPAYFKTGGTELLHQYVYVLKQNGFDAKITYVGSTTEKNINEAFLAYVDNYSTIKDIIDSEENVLVVPEIYTGYLRNFKHIKKIIWWESVDNYLLQVSALFCIKKKCYGNAIRVFLKKITGKNGHLSIRMLRGIEYHFVQSFYAYNFLKKKNIRSNVFYVSDYINNIYLNHQINYQDRDNIVLYNPKKGFNFTRKIMKSDFEHRYVPLVNLSNQDTFELLKRAKVYIDFGNHPGKDRFPREAAICGCCVIVGLNGSAKYEQDLPIPSKYKFNCKKRNIRRIIKKINFCLTNYEDAVLDFENYRDFILSEKENFEKNVLECFNWEE